MTRPALWLDDSPAPDVSQLTLRQLRDLWAAHRNDTQGLVAADEIVRRLDERLLAIVEREMP